MILDQRPDIAVMELVGEPLPGLEVEPRLIEAAAEALPILRNETRDETAGDHRAHHQQSVEQAVKKHHRAAVGSVSAPDSMAGVTRKGIARRSPCTGRSGRDARRERSAHFFTSPGNCVTPEGSVAGRDRKSVVEGKRVEPGGGRGGMRKR